MNSYLYQEIVTFLHHYRAAHLAIAGADGPWASVVRFISDDLVLYLLEARASDLVYYVENRPDVVLTVAEAGAGDEPEPRSNLQIFGTAQILSSAEMKVAPQEVGDAYGRLSQKAPGIYVVIQVRPARIHYYYSEEDGLLQRQTFDVSPQPGEGK